MSQSCGNISLPRRLPLLILDNVLFPGTSVRVPVNSPKSVLMIKNHLLNHHTIGGAFVGVVPREYPKKESGQAEILHPIGTAGLVVQVMGSSWPRTTYTLQINGVCRFSLDEIVHESPYLIGSVTQLDRLPGEVYSVTSLNLEDPLELELSELLTETRSLAADLIERLELSSGSAQRYKRLMNSLPSYALPDICTSIVSANHEERLAVLDAVLLTDRIRKALPLLRRQINSLEGKVKVTKHKDKIINGLSKDVRRGFQIDDDDAEDGDEIMALEKKVKSNDLPEHAKKAALKELSRLKKMPPHMPEHAMTRNYLELLVELPWNRRSQEHIDLQKSKIALDHDHFGLEKLKKRVLEYLAVRKLKSQIKGPILCFVGPPGVGKTSVGRSIAKSLGREFYRISLGGVSDQADIRGHRRTYIGSMPGRIIQGLKTVGVKNPVILLDEIDKMAAGIHGDPAAALLEVLDPEQNSSFTDHYLNISFDLSEVLFIATANTVSTVPGALLDRMELITIPGYTHEEKEHIARDHLLPKQLEQHGILSSMFELTDDAIRKIISSYTREAGVRALERRLSAICRAAAVKIVEANPTDLKSGHIGIDQEVLEEILGPPLFEFDIDSRLVQPGVAIGLAWTAVGGEIMFVEASKMGGCGQLTLTGQLGDVMKESATLALNWLRINASRFDLNPDIMEGTDIHIHFPAGAVEKDGPSAGVTIACVLVSLFTQRIVASDVAMTGEITLQGLVLPVGGIKEKVLAAHRCGLSRVILPRRNRRELQEIPRNVRENLTFYLAGTIEDVLQQAFVGGFPQLRPVVYNTQNAMSKL
ncbi:lon protease homolog 2, peroxisomal [Galendromus occidentalis]|uniref:Lon protease homolog n=1 Tax=Galendromus occidentalis TaxID=34638 RepID=A0AAJ6QW54_9ACAR|nr:lon protease homolog 2, peroxisomal [Galendromus occidentalis]